MVSNELVEVTSCGKLLELVLEVDTLFGVVAMVMVIETELA